MATRFINFGIYGDGDLYGSDIATVVKSVANQEVHGHRVAVQITYTGAVVPGGSEAFRINDIRLRLTPDRQGSFTHEAFIDKVTPSTRIALQITHAGSEFIISHAQLIAQRKKHQPIG